jgi:hypothetical protein
VEKDLYDDLGALVVLLENDDVQGLLRDEMVLGDVLHGA